MTILKNERVKKMKRQILERTFNDLNEQYSLEEIFEMFDIDPFQAFESAYDNGLIDDEILEELVPSDT